MYQIDLTDREIDSLRRGIVPSTITEVLPKLEIPSLTLKREPIVWTPDSLSSISSDSHIYLEGGEDIVTWMTSIIEEEIEDAGSVKDFIFNWNLEDAQLSDPWTWEVKP